jgi:hypothetical protein
MYLSRKQTWTRKPLFIKDVAFNQLTTFSGFTSNI